MAAQTGTEVWALGGVFRISGRCIAWGLFCVPSCASGQGHTRISAWKQCKFQIPAVGKHHPVSATTAYKPRIVKRSLFSDWPPFGDVRRAGYLPLPQNVFGKSDRRTLRQCSTSCNATSLHLQGARYDTQSQRARSSHPPWVAMS